MSFIVYTKKVQKTNVQKITNLKFDKYELSLFLLNSDLVPFLIGTTGLGMDDKAFL